MKESKLSKIIKIVIIILIIISVIYVVLCCILKLKKINYKTIILPSQICAGITTDNKFWISGDGTNMFPKTPDTLDRAKGLASYHLDPSTGKYTKPNPGNGGYM